MGEACVATIFLFAIFLFWHRIIIYKIKKIEIETI
jgi:hypothetical protein